MLVRVIFVDLLLRPTKNDPRALHELTLMMGYSKVTFERWQALWQQAGASNSDANTFDQLLFSYSEPHRKYHTVQHLEECFNYLDQLHSIADRAAEVELALWFHDAIYNTTRKDNEEKSADWARNVVLANGLSGEVARRIYDLIMITKHDAIPVGTDAEVLVDIDLSILGSQPARFDEYEQQIRQEYSWVPDPMYRNERKRILEQFLSRPFIYSTDQFRASYETQARDNIARSLNLL